MPFLASTIHSPEKNGILGTHMKTPTILKCSDIPGSDHLSCARRDCIHPRTTVFSMDVLLVFFGLRVITGWYNHSTICGTVPLRTGPAEAHVECCTVEKKNIGTLLLATVSKHLFFVASG